ncbi:NAD(+) synthase [Chloroflexota bacterium]
MKDQISLREMMDIDCVQVSKVIVDFIRSKVKEKGKDGIVLGLSGGLDSSTVAILAVKAMGDSTKVHALYLPDRDSQKKFKSFSQQVAEQMGVIFKEIPITMAVREAGIYKSPFLAVTSALPVFNRFTIWSSNKFIYPLFFKKKGFTVTLEQGASARNPFTRFIHNSLASTIEEGFNVRHRLRRKLLEDYAEHNNLLLVGCANKSESFVGWFVKDGVDDLPVEIIMDLYKCQVRQLARYLGVPKGIVEAVPSPDMFQGVGDEDLIGFSYEKIDKVAYVIEHDLKLELAYNEGITVHEFEMIRNLNLVSAWKRQSMHEFPRLTTER